MNKTTYYKIREKRKLLLALAHQPNELEELFDEPYRLALDILRCPLKDPHKIAKELELNWQTIKQILSALYD
jgi:hypothetical protein